MVIAESAKKMKMKTVSGIMLTLLLASILPFSSNGQSVEAQPVPSFVLNNKLIHESGNTYQWMDPHVSYYQYDFWTLWHSVETLLWYERDNATKIIPWLAESYTASEDGLHYNFTLRQGITFQDGTSFNATAVWFSLNRLLIMDATSGDPVAPVHGSQAGWMVMQLVDPNGYCFTPMGARPSYDASWVNDVLALNFVEVIDEYKVAINLAVPTTQFLPIMAGPWAGIISPTETIAKDYEYGEWGTWDGNYTTYFMHRAGDGDSYFNVPEDGWTFGTGAYYVESVSPTTYKIVLKAYDDYWGGPNDMNLPPAGRDRVETIEFVYQPSFTTRLLNLKAGTVTAIDVPEVDIFSVVDRDLWLEEAELVSTIPDVTVHGVFPTFNTWWLCFCTNITNPDGSFKSWQPFCDPRLRLAAASAVNMTFANIHINHRLSLLANNIIPPGTAPEGSYNSNVKPIFSFDLAKAEELIIDAYENPLNSMDYDMYYYNGTKIPAGVVDNSFSPANPRTIQFYVQTGADTFISVLTTMADNLNAISRRTYGLVWEVVLVPGGQQYTLASRHQIDSYMGGWIANYNHVLDWLYPMYLSVGVYPSWNQWNITALDDLYGQAVAADQAGNIIELLRINDEMNTLANELLMYMVWWHDTEYYTRSSWLLGWYVNTNYGVDLWSAMYYEQPEPVHDIAIISATASPTQATAGEPVTITATLANEGDFSEVFSLIVYYDATVIEVANVTLDAGGSATSTFTWDTTGVLPGTYTIRAEATLVEGEVDASDNMLVDGSVTVTSPPAPPLLSIKLSGEHDYLFMENVKIRLAALVKDAATMEPVSDVNVTLEIYDPDGVLWVSDMMVEMVASTGIYEWESEGTIRQLRLQKGVYLVHVQASFQGGLTASDILEFHVDPPAGETNQTLYHIAFTTVALVGLAGLILKRRKIANRLRKLNHRN